MKRILLALIILYILSFSIVNAQESGNRPKVGLVLSGGVARGFAHIGVLKVLEEAGIPIDYIGGTSMGSIIGGLYAIGYSADSIEKIALSQDWAEVFTDRVPRKYLSVDEKEKELKYFIQSPISDGKLKLPSGALAGQNLELLLSRLSWNVSETERFALFPIPFLCVATDIETGDPVVLKEGNLPHSMRASMSVPGVFMPEEIDSTLMVDGGLADNFPVEEVKQMGADIIIGVDVGFEPYDKNELNSVDNILEQSFFIYTVDENAIKQKKCDVLIKPEVKRFALSDFTKAKEIIDAGDSAARKQFQRLKMLAEFVKGSETNTEEEPQTVTDKIEIASVNVSGNVNIPTGIILSKFNINLPAKLNSKQIEEGIERIYGSQFFSKVEYSINSEDDGNSLSIKVIERLQDRFAFGANYNTDLCASLLMNAALYNRGLEGSKIFADLVVGQSPSLNLSFIKQLGWKNTKPSMNQYIVGFNTYATSLFLGNYTNSKKISNYRLNNVFLNLYSEAIVNNSFSLSLGIQNEFLTITDDRNIFTSKVDNSLFNFAAQAKFDTYNSTFFPESGSKLFTQVRYLTNFYQSQLQKGILADFKGGVAVPVIKDLTLIPSAFVGISLPDSIPEAVKYRMGGFNTYYTRNSFPLLGYYFMEYVSPNNAVARLDIQYKFKKRHFFILSANAGKASLKISDLFGKGASLTGYAATYGYNSIFGPVQVSIMNSRAHKFMAYLNVGLWF